VLIVLLKIFTELLIVLIPIYISLPKSWLYFEVLDNFRQNHLPSLIVILSLAILFRYFFENKIKNYKKHIKKLEESTTAYQIFITSSIEELLRDIFNNLSFGEEDRITLFLYSPSTNKFYFSGRYSSAPKLKKRGRIIIDNEAEYMYRVLNEISENHYKTAPQIKNNWLKKRTMESNSMYGVPIWDDKHDIKIGVLIFQSYKEKAYRSKSIRNKIKDEAVKIEELVQSMKINPSILPSDTKPLKGF